MDAVSASGARDAQLITALAKLRQRLAAAAAAAGRKVGEVELLPVTKYFPATDVVMLTRLGCRAFAESRDQEARKKIAGVAPLLPSEVPAGAIAWHMVGQVQHNKAKSIARWAHTVHSVSSARVAGALAQGAALAMSTGVRTEPLRAYVQIGLDGDASRGGVDIADPAGVDALCEQVADSAALELAGVMGVPPLHADADASFARLAAEHRRVMQRHPGAVGLSAGMSADLEIAVKHGSTCVRVGTALMGPRPLTSP